MIPEDACRGGFVPGPSGPDDLSEGRGLGPWPRPLGGGIGALP